MKLGDRVRHVNDPAVGGVVVYTAAPQLVQVRWDDGYTFTYREGLLVLEQEESHA